MTSQSNQKPKKVDFYKRPFRESIVICKAKLSGATFRVLEFLSACSTFAGEVVYAPPAKQLAEILGMGLSTVYYCFDRIKQSCPFIQIETNSAFVLAYRLDPNNPQKFLNFKNLENLSIQKNQFQSFRKASYNLESQELYPPQGAEHSLPQTLQTDHTPQTGGKNDLNFNRENNQEKSDTSQFITGEKKPDKELKIKENVSANVVPKTSAIPQDLLEKLRGLEIEPTEQVINAIERHHISQAYGAVAHIESTWVTIRNPRKVFLHQLPKQPIEEMGMRYGTEAVEKAKRESYAIELERQTPEYHAGWQEAKAKIDRILGRQKK